MRLYSALCYLHISHTHQSDSHFMADFTTHSAVGSHEIFMHALLAHLLVWNSQNVSWAQCTVDCTELSGHVHIQIAMRQKCQQSPVAKQEVQSAVDPKAPSVAATATIQAHQTTSTWSVTVATAVRAALPADLISFGLLGLTGADTDTTALDPVLG